MRALTRSTLNLTEAGFLSLPWRYTIGYLLADWGGYHEWMTYLGLLPLGLGLLALWQEPSARARWFWLALAALEPALRPGPQHAPLSAALSPAAGAGLGARALAGAAAGRPVQQRAGRVRRRRAAGTGAFQRAARARYLATLLSVGALLTFVGLGLGFAWSLPGAVPPAVVLLTGVGAAGSLAWFLSLQPRVPRPWCRPCWPARCSPTWARSATACSNCAAQRQ